MKSLTPTEQTSLLRECETSGISLDEALSAQGLDYESLVYADSETAPKWKSIKGNSFVPVMVGGLTYSGTTLFQQWTG